MALPRKLKAFNFSVNGDSLMGETTEVTLPKLTKKMEGYRAGGMNTEVDIDMGNEKLELEFTLGGNEPNLVKLFGGTIDHISLRFNGAYQKDDEEAVDAVDIFCRGRLAEIDRGGAKSGDDTEHKYKMSLTYYKETVNGEDIVEIDALKLVEIVGGVDRTAEIRKAIGL